MAAISVSYQYCYRSFLAADELQYLGTALQAAAYSGRDSIVETLLERGADPNAECGYLLTPFFSACCMGHDSTATMLLAAGADPNAPSDLFRNIWDSDELSKLAQNSETYINTLRRRRMTISFRHALLEEAAAQFEKISQSSSAEEMSRRAQEEIEKLVQINITRRSQLREPNN